MNFFKPLRVSCFEIG
uniref:Uncharacterized protein n=1 Tax=Rhizophora mucronata TaxID=61149 RepID=A0A2P2N974_RHIMU